MPRLVSFHALWVIPATLVLARTSCAQEDAARTFFETSIRPLLAGKCGKCHGAAEHKSGLRLDHGSYVLRGGARGPAVAAFDVEGSRLIAAVRYDDVDLQMPPKGKLTASEIAALERWVREGAVWPDEPLPAAPAAKEAAFDLAARRAAHWCWQDRAHPEVPAVRDVTWPHAALDLFVLAKLEAHGLHPASDAESATWLRRVSFDLCGLPSLPREVAAFVTEDTPAARAQVVDRLLASPHFGERWARHWLDLVRYAETLGHEYDFEIPNAWQYRDYVVRAFNQDVPYDRFVAEHIAGDLLAADKAFGPRLHAEGYDESPLGTCFYWFGDQTHSPLDPQKHRADRIDNQIDVLSKTFLGVTVSCARCHDHKFDAIAQRDYYSLAGVLKSSRYGLTPLLPRGGHAQVLAALDELRPRLVEHVRAAWRQGAAQVAGYLQALRALPPFPERPKKQSDETWSQRVEQWDDALAEVARLRGLERRRLRAFFDALPADTRDDREHPLQAWAAAQHDAAAWPARWRELRADVATPRTRPADAVVLADFRHEDYRDVFVSGEAFGRAPTRRDLVAVDGRARPVVRAHSGRAASSAVVSLRPQGSLATRTFRIDRRYLFVAAAGERCRINVVVEGFNVIRDPIYGALKLPLFDAQERVHRFDLDMWRGMQAYLQCHDLRTADPSDETEYGDEPGWIAVTQAWLSDVADMPRAELPACVDVLGSRDLAGEDLAGAYARAIEEVLARWDPDASRSSLRPAQVALLNFCARHQLLDAAPADGAGAHDPFLALVRGLDSAIAEVPCVPAMTEGDGLDEHVFVRGDCKTLGAVAPRSGLLALGSDPARYRAGSGRLALARELTAPEHPLVARVLVNRVWHHLFGQGLVPTVDNFGVLGEAPQHQELLDFLANAFVAGGWSLKALIRRIVLSRTYGLASQHGDPCAYDVDPAAALLSRARVRRLDGEALRDALLALSGRLDRRLYGKGVPVFLTPFMDGRGRPERSGPLDGAGRRSIYQEVRRNFLNPTFLAFDTPIPFTTVGRRNLSNVPAQALALMNDGFVVEQSRRWAERVLRHDHPDRSARVAALLCAAYGRAPAAAEIDAAEEFLLQQARAHDGSLDALAPWTDLTHALVNVKEFVFLR
jgi:cytochrome c553